MTDPHHHAAFSSVSLKRSRSIESLEKALKRHKPFQRLPQEEGSAPSPPVQQSDALYPDPSTLYHNNQWQQQQQHQPQQQHPISPPHQSFKNYSGADADKTLKSFSISTRSSTSQLPIPPVTNTSAATTAASAAPTEPYTHHHSIYSLYQPVNNFLYHVHVERFGDPELRERWWEQLHRDDLHMEEEQQPHSYQQHSQYESNNAILRQAFLMRQQQQEQQQRQHK